MDKVQLTQIVKEVQKDIGQFELLYSQIVNRVYYWCYTVIGNEAEAKDVAQEAMIRIYNKLHTLENPETFSSWMYILVRNVCYAFLRSRKSADKLFLDSEEYTEDFENNLKEERLEVLPKEAYDQKATKQLVAGFIHALPRKQKEVITLFYLEEFKIQEIADMLDCSVGTIKSRLFDGRKSLEKNLSEYQEKNNVKLYSIAVVPLLGLILREHCDELSQKHGLSYNADTYKPSNKGNLDNIGRIISNNILATVGVVFIGTLVVLIALLAMPVNNNNKIANAFDFDISLDADMDMHNKLRGHPYIENIVYSTFPTKTSVNVTIHLKEEVTEEEIAISLESKDHKIQSHSKTITFDAEENGIYEINLFDTTTKLSIDTIDAYAPELITAFQQDGYLHLIVDDEQSQINYQKSYVEWNGNKYYLSNKLIVEGKFSGVIKVVLYDNNENYIRYSLNL